MWTIIDRLLLVACCMAAMLAGEVNAACIAGMLAAIIMNCVILYLGEGAVCARTALVAVYAFFGVLFPELLWMSPALAYELCYQKKRVWFFLAAFLFFFYARMEAGIFKPKQLLYMLLLFFAAWALAEKTDALRKRKRDYQQLQDAYSELREKAEHQQLELAGRQDNEIYLATLAERNRIAREIHDNVGHMLSRSILQVGALKAVNGQEGLIPQLEALQSTLNAAMDNIRESVHDLKDEAFDLEADLKKLVGEYTKFQIQLDYDVGSQTPRALKYCFAAIVREGLTNIAKHSDATKVRIVAREHPALYQLLIEDNGTGHGQAGGGGMGLENMRERAEAFGGSFYVSREKGFRIFLSIPKES